MVRREVQPRVRWFWFMLAWFRAEEVPSLMPRAWA